jgi:tripartite-type tricarboxylate transporter receptor subunit TctC
MPRKHFCSLVISIAAFLFAAGVAAQAYPDRPIKLVVPYPPGGSTDPVARLLAADVATRLGQPVVVDNKPGAAGSIGTEFVARAAPDVYTALLHTSVIATDPTFKKTLPYDVRRDLAPVTLTVNGPYLLVVNPTLPVKNVAELIAYAKANPGKLNFGSAGQGSSGHLIGELFKMSAGIDMVHVPYKGSGQAVIDLLGGQVQMMFSGMSSVMQHIKAGRLRPLAVTGAQRSPAVPDVPTIAESGFPGFQATAWYGVLATAGTPKPIVNRLHDEIVRALALPDVKERLNNVGFELVGGTPDEFAAFIKSEIAKWTRVVRDAHISAE